MYSIGSKNNEVVYQNSFELAILEQNIPISSKTVFELGSVAKQFTGFGIAVLIDQHKINLDDDIRTYSIPTFCSFGRTTPNE